MKTKADKIIKSIHKKISEYSLKNDQELEPRTFSSSSKQTCKSSSKNSQFSRSSKKLPLAGRLEEIDKRFKENLDVDFSRVLRKTQSFPESEALVGLLEDKNILSESTVKKIKEFKRKVSSLKETINSFSKTKEEKNGLLFKPSESLKKARASDWNRNMTLVKRKRKPQNTII